MLEFVNIRNQDSWVHMDQPELATIKAKDLVRMAVAKALYLQPLKEENLNIAPRALIVGGGISGMAAARAISRQGFPATIVEYDSQLGGQARHLYQTAGGKEIAHRLNHLIDEVAADPDITVHLNAKLEKVEGFVGNFRSTVSVNGQALEIDHGVTVIASGAQEFQPDEYLFGKNPRVITGLELDRRLKQQDPDLSQFQRAVFIQCVGSREPHRPYCSRICCTHSVAAALHLKEKNPSMDVFIPGFIIDGPLAGLAEVNPVLCKGCGLCVASCRSGALQLQGFNDAQIMAMIDAC